MTHHSGSNPARGRRTRVERYNIAALPDGDYTLEAALPKGHVATLDMTREELVALRDQINRTLGDDGARVEVQALLQIAQTERDAAMEERDAAKALLGAVTAERDALRRQLADSQRATSLSDHEASSVTEHLERRAATILAMADEMSGRVGIAIRQAADDTLRLAREIHRRRCEARIIAVGFVRDDARGHWWHPHLAEFFDTAADAVGYGLPRLAEVEERSGDDEHAT